MKRLICCLVVLSLFFIIPFSLSEQITKPDTSIEDNVESNSEEQYETWLKASWQLLYERYKEGVQVSCLFEHRGDMSSYNKWQQSQSVSQGGDIYDSITNGLKNIKDLYSEGLIGTAKFKSAVELMSGKSATSMNSNDLIDAYETSYPTLKKWFTADMNGVRSFIKDLEKIEMATKNAEGGWDISVDVENAAEVLGVSTDVIEAVLCKLSDYGFNIFIARYEHDIEACIPSHFLLLDNPLKASNSDIYSIGNTIDNDADMLLRISKTYDFLKNTQSTVDKITTSKAEIRDGVPNEYDAIDTLFMQSTEELLEWHKTFETYIKTHDGIHADFEFPIPKELKQHIELLSNLFALNDQ